MRSSVRLDTVSQSTSIALVAFTTVDQDHAPVQDHGHGGVGIGAASAQALVLGS
jgi:hypothetical protein